jgi:uncharacterized protein GlcG (DUF336 family)
MAERPVISSAQAQAAIKAMTEKAAETPDQGVAMAIVDEAGNMVAYSQMDNLRMFARRHCVRKAYTAAIVGADTAAHGEGLKDRGATISDMGDPQLTPGGGGVVVRSQGGVIMGGIGVGGYPGGHLDEALARVGLEAMNI